MALQDYWGPALERHAYLVAIDPLGTIDKNRDVCLDEQKVVRESGLGHSWPKIARWTANQLHLEWANTRQWTAKNRLDPTGVDLGGR